MLGAGVSIRVGTVLVSCCNAACKRQRDLDHGVYQDYMFQLWEETIRDQP